MARFDPQVVFHLAAKTEVAWSFDDYEDVSDVNYIGTVRLAEACRQLCTDFQLFIMASTMETYGHHEAPVPFTEGTPQYPMAPYAVAKVAAEKYLQYMQYAYNFPFTILRQTNTYGRDRNDFFVMERIITQMLTSNEINLGEPDPIRNFLYISDLIDLYEVVLEKRPVGSTFAEEASPPLQRVEAVAVDLDDHFPAIAVAQRDRLALHELVVVALSDGVDELLQRALVGVGVLGERSAVSQDHLDLAFAQSGDLRKFADGILLSGPCRSHHRHRQCDACNLGFHVCLLIGGIDPRERCDRDAAVKSPRHD